MSGGRGRRRPGRERGRGRGPAGLGAGEGGSRGCGPASLPAPARLTLRLLLLAARDGAPCVFGGMVYRSGESFQSSCKYQCTCLDGAVGCVPLCSMDVLLPSPDCPYPRRVKLPGKCCEEWVCDEAKEQTAVGPALAGEWGSLCGRQPGGKGHPAWSLKAVGRGDVEHPSGWSAAVSGVTPQISVAA